MDNTSAFSISALLEHDIQELKGKRLADVFRLISFIPGETYGQVPGHLRIEINYVKKGVVFCIWNRKVLLFVKES